MITINDLEKEYYLKETEYSQKESQASLHGHIKVANKYAKKRILNDRVYFLYMFTLLEGRIRILSDKLMQKKKSTLTKWQNKAPWLNMSEDDLHLMKRVTLLKEKGRSDYTKIKEYYTLRNQLGHGSEPTREVNMSTEITTIKHLYEGLSI